jgi:hypothetical protein
MKINDFQNWLDRYGRAWVEGDPDTAGQLFAEDAAYYEEPFIKPMLGREAIRRYWTEGAQEGQTNITCEFSIIAVKEDTGYAHWRAAFTRIPANTHVDIDGILAAKFDEAKQCTEFREWWHRREV